jgi:hypothetical protein
MPPKGFSNFKRFAPPFLPYQCFMFLIRSLTFLVAIPFFWVGQLLGALWLPGSITLLKTAWWISHDDQIGLAALRRIHQREPVANARRQAAQWLATRPRAGMACFAGLLALEAGDWDEAVRLRDLCRTLGDDEEGLIDWLELRVCGLTNDDRATEDLYCRLASRTDLSPAVSRMVLNYFLFQSLLTKNWEEVERRAKHLASIEDSPLAATAFWALDQHRGERRSFHGYIQSMNLDPDQILYYQGIGYSALEEWEQAFQMLVLLREADAQFADSLQATLVSMGATL